MQIVEHHDRGEQEARRRVWFATVVFVVGLMVFIGVNVWLQQRTELLITEPRPAAVILSIEKPKAVPILCPGDVLQYRLTLDIDAPNVGTSVINVKNLDTRRVEVATSTPRIDEEIGVIAVQTNWRLPLLLPATATRPERPWSAGRHRRIIAITSDEGDKRADQEYIDFIISATCPNVKL